MSQDRRNNGNVEEDDEMVVQGIEQISLQSQEGVGCDSDGAHFDYSSNRSQWEPCDEEGSQEWYDENMEGFEQEEDEAYNDEGTEEWYDEDMEGSEHLQEDALDDEVHEWEERHVEEFRNIDCVEDIKELDLHIMGPAELVVYDFANLDLTRKFYVMYARTKGFAARQGNKVKNKDKVVTGQTFLCNRQGERQNRGLTDENRKRKPRPIARCWCQAMFHVHVDMYSGRWYITKFEDDHNHEMYDDLYCGMIPAYRGMNEAQVMQMNNMMKVGIRPPLIYSSFARKPGGFEKIGFQKKDLYNKIARQRHRRGENGKSSLNYIRSLHVKDPLLCCEHTVDDEGRLQHLFWSDGFFRMDYMVFGDVMAFAQHMGKTSINVLYLFSQV